MRILAQIVVTLTEDDKIGVKFAGPGAESKIILLGMLESAKAALVKAAPAEERSSIVVANGALPKV